MESIHKGHRERLKTRFRNAGLDSFSEHEVLELLLMYAIPKKDVNPLAHSLIREHGSLKAVLEADYGHLIRNPGIGANAATLITLIAEATKYADVKHDLTATPDMSNSGAAGRFCAKIIGHEANECVALLSLKPDLKLIRHEIIQSGSYSETPIYTRRVAEIAMRNNAAAVILCHNHPSGVVKPSKEDVAATESVNRALAVLGIALADHIIVSGKEYYSMFANKHFAHAQDHGASVMLAMDVDEYTV